MAWDGDADRIGVVDGRGQIVWGDQLMMLFSREVLANHPGAPIIFEVKCSQGLVEEIERLGGQPVMYRTGHSLIKNKMKEMHAPLAGEMSGHLFFSDEYFGYDDALYAALPLCPHAGGAGQAAERSPGRAAALLCHAGDARGLPRRP